MTSTSNEPRGPLDAAEAHDYADPPGVNLELLRKHVAWVLAQDRLPNPERRWFQNDWVWYPGLDDSAANDADISQARANFCETGRCIAGNIVFENGTLVLSDNGRFYARAETGDVDPFEVLVDGEGVSAVHISEQAERLLGINNDKWELFHGHITANNIRYIAEQIAASVGETL